MGILEVISGVLSSSLLEERLYLLQRESYLKRKMQMIL